MKAIALAVPLLFISACSQFNDTDKEMEAKQTYSLCPKTEDAQRRLSDLVRSFANEQDARLIDRSAGAQRELSGLDSDVLNQTGGSPILITVEKAGEYRISVTNLGLREKVALSVRSLGETAPDNPVASFMEVLSHFWTIEESEDNVTDDPPC
ncbi:hypothetical protein [Pontixanthobacter sp.]|uniref:hypothetical protein n=1 Tax=Pontixanthobacter sp. TaxID=2792078 RepID=UPI003C7D2766